MDIEWLTGAIGIGLGAFLTTGVSAIFNRKKDKADVDSIRIDNLSKAIELYQATIDRLNDELKESKEARERVEEKYAELEQRFLNLRDVIYEVLDQTCLDTTCTSRKKYTNKKIQEVLEKVKEI